jgi:hypothetical protein
VVVLSVAATAAVVVAAVPSAALAAVVMLLLSQFARLAHHGRGRFGAPGCVFEPVGAVAGAGGLFRSLLPLLPAQPFAFASSSSL